MAKGSSIYSCQQCGYESTKWFGRCPDCGEWNSAVESVASLSLSTSKRWGKKAAGEAKTPIALSDVKTSRIVRLTTKISELDRVLGGGIVAGQVVLVAGEPGVGKSTILLQMAEELKNVLYVSGEESAHQIKIRADRLGTKSAGIQVLEETDIDNILTTVGSLLLTGGSKSGRQTVNSNQLSAIIVDSIQTMSTTDLTGMPGSVGQVRESAFRLVKFAKSQNIPVFIVGHVTKEGSVAGPAALAHIVDTVLWFEGDRTLPIRLLRAVKNRFGPTDEVGVFTMEEKGVVSARNPEKLFLSDIKGNVAGNVTSCVLKGSRPMFVEIQTLVVPTKLVIPRRIAQGIDPKRFELLLAVLTRRAGLPLYEHDCFVNIAGGISAGRDPAVDLAVCLSVASSYFNKSLPKNTFVLGEVGLLGDVREVISQGKILKEARRLGFGNLITSEKVRTLQEAIKRNLR